jgi:hypothetical protein
MGHIASFDAYAGAVYAFEVWLGRIIGAQYDMKKLR